MTPTKCFDCQFFLSFTPAERTHYNSLLTNQGLNGHFFGACTYQGSGPGFIINRYLKYPIKDCPYYKRGYMQEKVGRSCPNCRIGVLVIKRPRKNEQTFTTIGCTRYPDCRYSTKSLQLDTNCRYCNIPLVLNCDEQLICACPQCHRKGVIALTIASRPHLFAVGLNCIHNSVLENCEICAPSKEERRNIVDVELPKVAKRTNTLMNIESRFDDDEDIADPYQHSNNYNSFDDENDIIFIPPSMNSSLMDDDYLEERALHWQELDEYSEDMARSKDEGWFYPE